MGITRRLPISSIGRDVAMGKAKVKNDSLPPGTTVLHPETKTRLDLASPLYHNARLEITVAEGLLRDNTVIKDPAIANSRMWVSHFIQVFNLGVARNVYTEGQRGYYLLPVDSDALPPLGTDTEVTYWADQLISGDPARVLAGGAAMVNPTVAEVSAVNVISKPMVITQNTLTDALDTKREVVESHNVDADKLIKRVWDEIEAFYGEEAPESKRQNARLWGVVYVTTGPPATLTGLVKDGTGAPRIGATLTIDETGATATTNTEGRYTDNSQVVGTVHLRASFPGKPDVVTEIEIPEHESGITIEVPDIVIP